MTLIKTSGPIPKKLTHGRKPANRGTKNHKAYMGKVAELPCCLSAKWGHECSPDLTVAHKDGAGMALKSSDYDTFPLCTSHHLWGPHSIGQMGVKAWQKRYGPQAYWIEQTKKVLDV